MTRTRQPPARRAIALWLFACAALIYAMVVLGGVTRLTHSGLSIVAWDPIVGAIPPLNATQWRATFQQYQRTPEYRDVNYGMSLARFKSIFYVEYAHRLLGRLIGLAFLLPLLYFAARRRIEASLAPKLVGIFALGALQGALGWFMVKSGLVSIPRVSPYRLTAHLGLAVAIYAYILWVAFGLRGPPVAATPAPAWLRRLATGVTALIFLMILSGGFVAGTHAGFAFNTFPLMNGRWIPPGLYALRPWWVNPFENIATVQFDHRLIAYALCLVIPACWIAARRVALPRRARLALHALLAMLVLQVALGITTLLLVVPVPVAATHQAGAVALFTIALFLTHELQVPGGPPGGPGAGRARQGANPGARRREPGGASTGRTGGTPQRKNIR